MAETDVKVENTETGEVTESETAVQDKPVEDSPEVAKLKAEIAKHKAALDKATKEAGEYKKQLRASKSAEEQRAEEEKERQEAIENELKTLRKQAAVGTIGKKVMGFVGDEAVANTVAEALYGAEDVDAALDEINKAWTAREKKLRLEYGKIPAPEAGDIVPRVSAEAFAKMGYMERLELKRKSPDTYRKLTMTK